MTGGRGRGDRKSNAQGASGPLRAAEKWRGGWGKVSRGRRRGWTATVTDPENRACGFKLRNQRHPPTVSPMTLDIAANRTGNIPA